ncbi:winged helix-turn-helix transcriptional regulator [Nonomuraea sp. NN258]|uniref:MarR family winged helix-turn-helix transcriptional regulator n=1 Tax=Nonomuraea antri TaxID=2730852 RepID=UPI00156841C7|nr:MarR family winged helix-turn-helix transcriptional regulator [Nonomuraea antri]NRQ30746.1 winged helix-turn-helix transcriptional regulator [Nonomuraea antri]
MNKPIGYWAKRLDTLLDEAMDRELAAQGVSRREWQALNTLATTGDDPVTALAPFAGVDDAMAGLTARGWLAGAELTPAGRAAHEAISDRVRAFRWKAAEGLTPEEYATTVDVLRRMAANLA